MTEIPTPMPPIPEIQRVVCAALRHKRAGSIICGARHFDYVMHQNIQQHVLSDWTDADQGFIDQWGNFLTRKEAHLIAKARGQFIHLSPNQIRYTSDELFSEDLY